MRRIASSRIMWAILRVLNQPELHSETIQQTNKSMMQVGQAQYEIAYVKFSLKCLVYRECSPYTSCTLLFE